MFAARLDDFTLVGGEAANRETLLATTRTAHRRILRSLLGAACRTRAPAFGHRSYPRIGRDLPVMPQVRRDGSGKSELTVGIGRFCCRSQLRQAARRDSVVVTRF